MSESYKAPLATDSLGELIGNTPMFEFKKLAARHGSSAAIFGKMECLELCGSVKDRIALRMIEDAEKNMRIFPGESVLIEPTSGNTGIALSVLAAAKGYRIVVVMPETMSSERRVLMAAFGAEIVISPGKLGMKGAISVAENMCQTNDNYFMLQQFNNPSNPDVHRDTTGPEIWYQMSHDVDIFVAGVGTGGTITGVSQFLKSQNKELHTVAVEPAESAVLSGKQAGPHKIQGIGAGFVPSILDTSIIDETVAVSSDDAFAMAQEIPRVEGIFVGISAGAAMHAALEVGKRPENAGKKICVIIPDFGERYVSTGLFKESTLLMWSTDVHTVREKTKALPVTQPE